MESIKSKEDKLFKRWSVAFEGDGYSNFCYDGLIHNGELYNNAQNRYSGNQEELWNNAKRRILFFMKEPNNNEGEDYREWGLYQQTSSTFFRFIYSWLNALSTVTADSPIPSMINELDLSLPLCIVNAKKESGGSVASYSNIYTHVDKYSNYLREQFDIYSANIIICGGTDKMINIVKDSIYSDINFTPLLNSDWIWYSAEKKIILFDSFHPCAIKSNHAKYDVLIEHFQLFLKSNLFEL